MYSGSTSMLGRGTVTGAQAQAWLESRGWAPPGFGQSYVETGEEFGVNWDLLIGQMAKETGNGTSAIFRDKRNPAGLAAENDDAYNKARVFTTWRDGQRAHAAHIRNYFSGDGWWNAVYPDRIHLLKHYGYYGKAAHLSYLDGRYATPGVGYGASVANFANVLVAFAGLVNPGNPPGMQPNDLRVMLIPGHFNTASGNAVEKAYINRVFKPMFDELQRRGIQVETIQGFNPNGTVREYTAGDHNAVARAAMQRRGQFPWNLYLDVHFEGVGNSSVRGPFGIYPHNDGRQDMDAAVRDILAPDMAKRISRATGMPLRVMPPPGSAGVMSETQTSVRALGAFSNTAGAKADAERMFIECGAFTSPADRAIMDRADFPQVLALQVADSIAAFYGVEGAKPAPPSPIDGDELNYHVPGYGTFAIRGGMAAFWKKQDAILREGGLSALQVWGLPLSDESDSPEGQGQRKQEYERARMEWHPGSRPDNYDILLGRVNAELLEALG